MLSRGPWTPRDLKNVTYISGSQTSHKTLISQKSLYFSYQIQIRNAKPKNVILHFQVYIIDIN